MVNLGLRWVQQDSPLDLPMGGLVGMHTISWVGVFGIRKSYKSNLPDEGELASGKSAPDEDTGPPRGHLARLVF
jgi:hypothetical protein